MWTNYTGYNWATTSTTTSSTWAFTTSSTTNTAHPTYSYIYRDDEYNEWVRNNEQAEKKKVEDYDTCEIDKFLADFKVKDGGNE